MHGEIKIAVKIDLTKLLVLQDPVRTFHRDVGDRSQTNYLAPMNQKASTWRDHVLLI